MEVITFKLGRGDDVFIIGLVPLKNIPERKKDTKVWHSPKFTQQGQAKQRALIRNRLARTSSLNFQPSGL